jgi:uncharacterized phage protein (TIGR01671 family)
MGGSMMIEVRYRAWHKYAKLMKDVQSINFSGEWITVEEYGEDLKVNCWPFHYIELLQYSGARDKNGGMIYNGDIIKTNKNFYQVKFENSSYLLFPKETYFIYLSGFSSHQVEIVGNIYENPELLK